jgi:hypothetical protein
MTEVARRERKTRPRAERREAREERAEEAPRRRKSVAEPTPLTTPERDGSADAAELLLARRIATLTPVVTVAAALVVGATVALGPAILVLAGGALFGTIGFFWASLRTLGGEAPLAEGFEHMSRRRVESPDGASERKRTALRALKDLELEHSIGKIDDGDYAELASRYREEAKEILREMDRDVSPLRERAEQIASNYLAKRGALPEPQAPRSAPDVADEVAEDVPAPAPPAAPSSRLACHSCKTSNEVDAAFCKKCGARLSKRECPACSVVNEPDAVFCKKCGKSLDAPPAEKVDGSP